MIIHFEQINDKIITLRNKQVILDSDVAELYGVETKEINQAVKNNPEKFPDGYILNPTPKEWQTLKLNLFKSNYLAASIPEDLRSKILTAKFSKMRVTPKAFTERRLHMPATIAVIDAFAKLRELTRHLQMVHDYPEGEEQKTLLQQSGKLIGELLTDTLEAYDSETTVELNLALLKVKHTIKKKRADSREI